MPSATLVLCPEDSDTWLHTQSLDQHLDLVQVVQVCIADVIVRVQGFAVEFEGNFLVGGKAEFFLGGSDDFREACVLCGGSAVENSDCW